MTVGRWVLKFTLGGMGMWLFAIGLVGFGLGLPVRRLAIPWLLMSTATLVMAFVMYWARSPVDQKPTPAAPRRFAFAMLALINVLGSAMLWSAVLLGVISKQEAIHGYMPLFLPLSVILAISIFYQVRRRVGAA